MLTFDAFRRLPREEQNRRYKELSDYDKFLARMNDWGAPEPEGAAQEITVDDIKQAFGLSEMEEQ